MSFLNTHEVKIVFVLCALSAARIFLFSAAFPFFNNVDEVAHFDTVHKYSRGYVPRNKIDLYDAETGVFSALYGSPEYLQDNRPEAPFVPLWTQPDNVIREKVASKLSYRPINHEAHQPPMYYFVAGAWYKFLGFFRIKDLNKLYAVRFLNSITFAFTLLLAYFFVREFFPQNLFLRVGVPSLMAFFPQDALFAVTNDAFSHLTYTSAFYLLFKLNKNPCRHYFFYIVSALSVAAAFLTKFTNFTIFFVLGCVVVSVLYRDMKERGPEPHSQIHAKLILLCFLACGCVAFWLIRSRIYFGDLTGHYVISQTWTPLALKDMLGHPLFSLKGSLYFFDELIKNIWRGEMFWHGKRLLCYGNDLFFSASTVIFFACAWTSWGSKRFFQNKTLIYFSGFMACLLLTALLAWTSIAYDFGDCPYPSKEIPYVTSGRYYTAILLPFLLIYLQGMQNLFGKWKNSFYPLLFLFVVILWVTLTEVFISISVFKSPFNWFHF